MCQGTVIRIAFSPRSRMTATLGPGEASHLRESSSTPTSMPVPAFAGNASRPEHTSPAARVARIPAARTISPSAPTGRNLSTIEVLESSDGNRPARDSAVGNLAAEHKTGQGLGCPGPVVLSDLGGRLQKPFAWLTLVVAGVTSLAGAQYVRAGEKVRAGENVRPVDSGVLRQIDSARRETR